MSKYTRKEWQERSKQYSLDLRVHRRVLRLRTIRLLASRQFREWCRESTLEHEALESVECYRLVRSYREEGLI